MTKRGRRVKQARQLSFVHFRTWRPASGERLRAIPACMEAPTPRLERARTTPNRDKITCGECIEALKRDGLWQE